MVVIEAKRQGTDERMTLNMGPHHPSTHGVLRLELELEGETVVQATPKIGYLHTGFEKTFEDLRYQDGITLTDRMDYMSSLSNNLAWCLAVEKLIDLDVPERAQVLRVILAELTRISSHLVWLGTMAMDLGATTVFLYAFRERELILDLFEMVAGSRLTVTYLRIGGLAADVPTGFVKGVRSFVALFPEKLSEYEQMLTKNRIWENRTKGVGIISAQDAIDYGLSGPSLRGSGVNWDLRKAAPYSGYEQYAFEVPIGEYGDVYDRYLVRIEEMKQSLRIIEQALDRLPTGDIRSRNYRYALPPREEIAQNMEALIYHFKLVTEGIVPPKGEVYTSVESPKGEMGFYLVSDGSARPYRARVRPPCFINLQALPKMVEGRLLSDVVAVISSIDIVLGEVDR